MQRRLIVTAALLLLVDSSLNAQPQTTRSRGVKAAGARAIDDAALRDAEARPGDWIAHGRNYAETRYSPLAKIHAGNVKELGLRWSFDMESRRGLEATPIVVDGVMYLTGSWSTVFAIDARTGKQLWKWDPKVPRSTGQKACCDVVNRGVAVYKGRVYVGILDGRLAALDAATGKPVWEVETTDPRFPYTITGAPRIVKGKVLIGNGGGEYGVRGYFSAYDAATGKLGWRFYTVPGDPGKPQEHPALEKALKTWTGEWWKQGGGGTVWDSFAYDPELDLLYVGTGNGSPWNRNIRSPQGGDNLYVSSILALKPDTGELVWHYQTTPGDTWDFTATQHMILADLNWGGARRKVLMQAPKNGFFYVLDRTNGELLAADPFVTLNWAKGVDLKTGRPIENPAARYQDQMALVMPGPLGAHNWQPMSYHPGTGLVYVPAQEGGFPYIPDPKYEFRPGTWNLGVMAPPAAEAAPPTPGFLIAWDPVARKPRWKVQYPAIWNSGLLSTAGNLVFQGTSDGRFVAYSADRGEKLWEVAVGTGVIASPITYLIDGVQYVSVLAGWGGAAPLVGLEAKHGPVAVPGRLLTFALNGKAPMPPVTLQKVELQPVAFEAKPETLQAGMALYAQWCSVCHGIAAVGGGVIPDLRYSAPAVYASYPQIVLEGAMANSGMPSLKRWVKPEELEAIRLFVLSQRAKLIR